MNDCTPCKCTCHNGATCCAECYKKHKEPLYVVGDRLEITITGTLTTAGRNNGDALDLKLDDSSVSMYFSGYRGEVTGWAADSKVRKLPPPQPSGIGAVVRLTTSHQKKGLLFVGSGDGTWRRVNDGCTFGWDQICKDGDITILAEGYVE
jgi:hypothetical protein